MKKQLLGLALALSAPAVAMAVTVPHTFQSRTPASAGDVNTNFSVLAAALTQVESAVSSLQGIVGYVTWGSNPATPFHRKVYEQNKTGSTLKFPHGLGSNLPGRVLTCTVSRVAPATTTDSGQTFQKAIQVGTAAVSWCEIGSQDVWVEFSTTTPTTAGEKIVIVLDYVP